LKKVLVIFNVLVFSIFVLFLTACDFSSTKLSNIEVAGGIDKSNQPLDIKDVFQNDSSVIYVTGSISNAPARTVVSIEWIYLDADPEVLIDSVDLNVSETDMDFAFSLTKPTAGWPSGDYEARIYVDSTLEETVSFSVEAPEVVEDTAIDDVIAILETGGYVMESRDADSIAYFQLNMVNDKYDLVTTVVSCWLGYVNQVERWVEVVQFSSENEAQSYETALGIEATEGRLVYRQTTVVLVTYSQDTIDLFN